MSKITIPAQGASGRIEAQVMVKDAVGNIVPKEGASIKCSNIVTRLGLAALKPKKDKILELGVLSNVVSVGTGTQAELESVTGLAVPARSGTGTITKLPLFRIPDFQGTGKPLAVQEYVVTVRYAPDGTTRNYSEIGLGEPTAVQTYTLFKNSETLVPETLTVLGDEYLDISYYYQVQGLPVSGFTYNGHPNFMDNFSALADFGDNRPLGPFPVSGEGVEGGTSAYVLLYSRGVAPSLISTAPGVFYFTEDEGVKLGQWNPAVLRPISEHLPTSTTSSSDDDWGIVYSWAAKYPNTPSPYSYSLRFPEEYRPKLKDISASGSSGKLIAAPGALTSGEDILVVGYGTRGSGALVFLDKPIRVTKDSRFEVSVDIHSMWDTLPAVNSTFVSNPGG